MRTTILAVFAGCLLLVRMAPGGRLPVVRTRPLRAIALNAAQLGGVLVYPVLGMTPEARTVYPPCTALGEFFHTANCRTPHWVGNVFRRPEMHRIHYEHGRHRDNDGDIVLGDMLNRTWHNPRTRGSVCGFTAGREERLTGMRRLRDVHRASGAP